jgi:hypothetical protein
MSRTPALALAALAAVTTGSIADGQTPAALAPSAQLTLPADVTSLTAVGTGSDRGLTSIAAGLADGRIALWRRRDNDPVLLAPHTARVLAIGSTADGVALWSLAADGSLARTPASPGGESTSRSLDLGGTALRAGTFSSDGAIVITGGEFGEIRVFDTASGALRQQLRAHRTELQALAMRPASPILASASAESDLRLWDTATGRQISEIDGDLSLFALAFSPTDGTLASGGVNRRLALRDPVTFKSRREVVLKAPRLVATVAWSPDGRLIAVGDVDDETLSKGAIQVFASSTAALVASLDTGGIPAAGLTFADDGTVVAIVGRDLRAWTVATR